MPFCQADSIDALAARISRLKSRSTTRTGLRTVKVDHKFWFTVASTLYTVTVLLYTQCRSLGVWVIIGGNPNNVACRYMRHRMQRVGSTILWELLSLKSHDKLPDKPAWLERLSMKFIQWTMPKPADPSNTERTTWQRLNDWKPNFLFSSCRSFSVRETGFGSNFMIYFQVESLALFHCIHHLINGIYIMFSIHYIPHRSTMDLGNSLIRHIMRDSEFFPIMVYRRLRFAVYKLAWLSVSINFFTG